MDHLGAGRLCVEAHVVLEVARCAEAVIEGEDFHLDRKDLVHIQYLPLSRGVHHLHVVALTIEGGLVV